MDKSREREKEVGVGCEAKPSLSVQGISGSLSELVLYIYIIFFGSNIWGEW